MTERVARILEALAVVVATAFIADAWSGGAGRRWIEGRLEGYRSAGAPGASLLAPAELHPAAADVADVIEQATNIANGRGEA